MFWLISLSLQLYLRPRNTLAAAGSCKTWFYLFNMKTLSFGLTKPSLKSRYWLRQKFGHKKILPQHVLFLGSQWSSRPAWLFIFVIPLVSVHDHLNQTLPELFPIFASFRIRSEIILSLREVKGITFFVPYKRAINLIRPIIPSS